MRERKISKTVAAGLLLSAAFAVPAFAETTAYNHFTLIDGTGKPAQPDSAMVVTDGKIAWVGKASALKAPAGAQTVEMKGKYVIPGLIDSHVHLGNTKGMVQDVKYYTRDSVDNDLKTYAAYGVTTVQSLGTDGDLIFDIRKEERAGRPSMARVFTSGQGLVFKDSYGGIPGLNQPVANAAEARKEVDRQAAKGVDQIKFWMDNELGTMKIKMPYDVAKAIIDEAHAKHLRVVAHIFYLADAKQLADYGIDGFMHSVRDKQIDQATLDSMKAHHTWQVAATLSREYSFAYSKLPFVNDPFFTRAVTPDVEKTLTDPARDKQLASAANFPIYKRSLANAEHNFAAEVKAGVQYGAGTDSGPPGRFAGYFLHLELAEMVKAGLTPLQAITAATSHNAEFLHAKDLGTLEAGKQGDFVVLNADPTKNIENTHRISAVYISGRSVPTIWSMCAGRPTNACKGGPDQP
jgi:imidazolonepropionase-like amidohydrolase